MYTAYLEPGYCNPVLLPILFIIITGTHCWFRSYVHAIHQSSYIARWIIATIFSKILYLLLK